jgi:hypothetical protein
MRSIPRSVISIGRSAFSYSRQDANGTYDDRNNITKITVGDNVELESTAIRRFDFFYNSAVMKRVSIGGDNLGEIDLSSIGQLQIDLIYSNIKDIAPLSRSNSIKYVKVFEHDVEAGTDNNIRSRFHRKGIYLDIFYDDR